MVVTLCKQCTVQTIFKLSTAIINVGLLGIMKGTLFDVVLFSHSMVRMCFL